jgi:hypothetical protein
METGMAAGIDPADRTTRERLEASFGHLSVGDRAALHILLQLASEYVLVGDGPKAAEALDRALDALGLVPL